MSCQFQRLVIYRQADQSSSYHCLTSQGYEERGSSSAGVLGVGDCASLRPCLRLAAQARQLSTHVRVYTNGDEKLTAELTANLLPLGGISVEEGQIASLSKESEGASVTVNLIDGVSHLESFLVHKPRMKVNGQFMQQLGLETFTFGHEIIKVTPPFHETSMSGVFAIGDCASPQKVFLNSLSMGSFACAGLAAQLQMKAPKTS
jgi:thioredoxin reductase